MTKAYHDLWAPKIYTPYGFVQKSFLQGAKALDVGSGSKKLPGAVGMDILDLPTVDVAHDVNQTPWPFANESFDLLFFNHVLEHVPDVVKTIDEIHRVLVPGGRVVIQVPYFRYVDAFTDPTHKHFFTSLSLDYFVKGTELEKYHYSRTTFRKVGFWFGWPHDSKNPLRRLIKIFSHSHPVFYDRYVSKLFPVSCLTWELEKSN